MRELGQHFLVDAAVAQRIVEAAAVQQGETVVEIGPGKGALTRLLAGRCTKLVAIEIDAALAAQLKKEFAQEKGVEILAGDALRLLPQLPCDLLISNAPYPIAEALLRLLPALRFQRCVLVLPKPLVQKLQEPVESAAATALTLFFQLFFAAEAAGQLPAWATEPPAPHDGIVLRLRPRPAADAAERFLRELLRKQSRRLRNGVREALIAAGFCGTKSEGRSLAASLLRGLSGHTQLQPLQATPLRTLLLLRDRVQTVSQDSGFGETDAAKNRDEKPF